MSANLDSVQNYSKINEEGKIVPQKDIKEVREWNGNSNKIVPQYVRKKWTLVKFKRMIKKGGFISARLTAKALGVDKRTIEKWLQLPAVQRELASSISLYTKNIQKSKDWKAHAYLLEKVTGLDEEKSPTNDLKQLIVINT